MANLYGKAKTRQLGLRDYLNAFKDTLDLDKKLLI